VAITCDIDGTSIDAIAVDRRYKEPWNSTRTGVFKVPSGYVTVLPQSEGHVYVDGTLKVSGPVTYRQAEGNADMAYTEVTVMDHTWYLQKRICKTATGNLITPNQVLLDEVTAPAIMAAFIDNTNNYDPQPSPTPMPLTVGSVAGGGVDMSGSLMQWPMNLQRMKDILCATGYMDIILSPGIGASTVALTNGDGGSDLSGSVIYGYGTGAFNAQVATLTVDLSRIINALWYLLGPRVSDNRWAGSITPTARDGGPDGDGPLPGTPWPATLLARIAASRALLGYMQEIQVLDTQDAQDIRDVYENRWEREAWIRAIPRTFLSIRPERGLSPAFSAGDLITAQAGAILDGGFSEIQRVYEYEVTCDDNGVMEITSLLTSADQEGL
jgi:hypothetical protein